MGGEGLIIIIFMIGGIIFMISSTVNEHKEKKADAKERRGYLNEAEERERRNETRLNNALSSMDKKEGNTLKYWINKHNHSTQLSLRPPQPRDLDYDIKFKNAYLIFDTLRNMNEEQQMMLTRALSNLSDWNKFSHWNAYSFDDKFANIKQSILNPTKEQLEQRKRQVKLNEDSERRYSAVLLLEELKLYPLPEPVDKTGDYGRFKAFKEQIGKKRNTYKYLYLVKIKSKIDDKKLIKIGITSNEDIEKRFENDDVLELIEVIKSAKLSTKTAMALEYYLIRKYRPNDYFAVNEFDEFSRFDGYTEIIPMKHTTKVSEEIDDILKDSKNIAQAFQLVAQ